MNLNNDNTLIRNQQLPSVTSSASSYTAGWAASDLIFINNKMDQLKRDLTQWDMYKISATVSKEEEFLSKFNSLLPNTGMIIDSDTFNRIVEGESKTFSRGDIVYKNTDLSTTLIKSERGGNFYPSSLSIGSNNNNITIQYSFTNLTPTGTASVSTSGSTWTVDSLGSEITFSNIPIKESSLIYGAILTSSASSCSAAYTSENVLIRPVMKAFSVENEEVYYDLKYTITGTGSSAIITVTSFPSIISYVTVK